MDVGAGKTRVVLGPTLAAVLGAVEAGVAPAYIFKVSSGSTTQPIGSEPARSRFAATLLRCLRSPPHPRGRLPSPARGSSGPPPASGNLHPHAAVRRGQICLPRGRPRAKPILQLPPRARPPRRLPRSAASSAVAAPPWSPCAVAVGRPAPAGSASWSSYSTLRNLRFLYKPSISISCHRRGIAIDHLAIVLLTLG